MSKLLAGLSVFIIFAKEGMDACAGWGEWRRGCGLLVVEFVRDGKKKEFFKQGNKYA